MKDEEERKEPLGNKEKKNKNGTKGKETGRNGAKAVAERDGREKGKMRKTKKDEVRRKEERMETEKNKTKTKPRNRKRDKIKRLHPTIRVR